MAKAYICDVCGKAIPESELVRKEGINIDIANKNPITVNVRFLGYLSREPDVDVCKDCAKDLILEALKKIEKKSL